MDGAEPFLKHYVGVYDPETGNLIVLEARSLTVRATVRSHQPPVEPIAVVVSYSACRSVAYLIYGTEHARTKSCPW